MKMVMIKTMGLNGSNKNHYLAPLIKTMGQRDKGTKGQWDNGTKGQRDKGTKGQR
jgi:hypothetical protein